MKDFSQLEKKLGLKFKNKDLLIQAFVHRSYINENPKFYLEHNERLEFLGDSVLELAVAKYLFLNYKSPEGELTNFRAALVRAETLAKIGRELGFNDFILLSKGESEDVGRARSLILANTFEAFLGAIFLDQGFKKCEDFIKKHLIKELSQIIEKGSFKDSKSLFQEKAQEIFKITPVYKALSEKGPDHAKIFAVGVFLAKELIAKGQGFSKQEAELMAAKNALKAKGW